jgi:hypothetical protein
MNYTVAIPRPIRDEIASWGLPRKLLLKLYTILHVDLPGRVDTLPRLAAPSPTFVFTTDVPDENEPGMIHWFTFWLTFGEQEGYVYVRQCVHEIEPEEFPDQ